MGFECDGGHVRDPLGESPDFGHRSPGAWT